jgi:hypothetical protein
MVVVGESVVAGIPFDLRPEMFSGELFPPSPQKKTPTSKLRTNNLHRELR